VGVESRSEGERSARYANEDARFDAARPGFGPSQREGENESAREQKQSTTESLQQRTGRGRFDGRDALASNKALGSPSIETDRLSSRALARKRRTLERETPPLSRVVYAPMLMDMSSASVLVSRRRLSSALWCDSVLRIDITDQKKAAICARRNKASRSARAVRQSFHSFVVLTRSPAAARYGARTNTHTRTHTRHLIASRTKHIKNTLGPYSHFDSPGGASTAKTIPSMMNMASAQPNMNHTLALRPTKLDFSSSSFVVIFLSLLARRVAVKCGVGEFEARVRVRGCRPRPRRAARRLVVSFTYLVGVR